MGGLVESRDRITKWPLFVSGECPFNSRSLSREALLKLRLLAIFRLLSVGLAYQLSQARATQCIV